ncbi:MAG: hypothetical protein K8F91_18850 [Candidatus Obscuribacterales bacterium]|nr:hypothetical protein [Candidatus Obscuribacterales bacterium]
MQTTEQKKQTPSWVRQHLGWLVSFFVPFIAVGLWAGISEYRHGLKEIGKVYSIWGQEPNNISMLGDAGIFFLLAGSVAGIAGLALFGLSHGIRSLIIKKFNEPS